MLLRICFFVCVLISFISCDYKRPQKDKYPNIPTFSELCRTPEKLSLKGVTDENEDVNSLFITENEFIIVSYVGKGGVSADSIVITAYKSPTNFKKHYFKIKKSDEENSKTNPDISLYQTDYRDGVIYTTYHKFSTSDYQLQALDSTFIEKREQMQFDVNYGDHYESDFVLNPFEEIVIRNTTNCGGGRLGGSLVCPVYLSYYKMNLPQKTVYFKELRGMNQFKIIPIFNKKYLLFHPDDYAINSRLFLINE